MTEHNQKEISVWFKRIGYFNNTFVGDLFIFTTAIYYIAVADRTESLDKLTPPFLGSLGILISIPIILSRFVIDYDYKDLQISPEIQNTWQLEQSLDALVVGAKEGHSRFSSSMKPLRFAKTEVRNLTFGLRTLKFETEYDNHDFIVGMRKKQTKNSLQANGYL